MQTLLVYLIFQKSSPEIRHTKKWSYFFISL